LESPNFSKDSFGGFVCYQGVTWRRKADSRISKFFRGRQDAPSRSDGALRRRPAPANRIITLAKILIFEKSFLRLLRLTVG
jgi:hypothetical protein